VLFLETGPGFQADPFLTESPAADQTIMTLGRPAWCGLVPGGNLALFLRAFIVQFSGG
jgi:hypothetical protein